MPLHVQNMGADDAMDTTMDRQERRMNNTIVSGFLVLCKHWLTCIVAGTLCADVSIHGQVGLFGFHRTVGRRGAST